MQVVELFGPDSLVASSVGVRCVNCSESIYNHGSFGAQYDAQVSNIELVPGRKGTGDTADLFNEDNRMTILYSSIVLSNISNIVRCAAAISGSEDISHLDGTSIASL